LNTNEIVEAGEIVSEIVRYLLYKVF